MRIFTDLSLHENTPLRVQPSVGEWGPVSVVPTRRKRRGRWLWVAAFVAMLTILFVFGGWVYTMVMDAGV